jgi:hypothetical protein
MAINPSPGYPFAGSGAPGTDINAGLAQVLDFTKIPELVYGPEIDRAKAQLKANQDKIAEDRKQQETLLKRSAEADLARNAATQAKLQANLERTREILAYGNRNNINLGAPVPSPFVLNHPELLGMHKELQQILKDTDVLAQNELSTKQLIEKANTSIATGKSAPSSNYYKIKAAGDSNPSNRKALLLQDIGFDEGEFNDHRTRGEDVANILRISMRKIDRVKKRFVEEGLDAALGRQQSQRSYERKADGEAVFGEIGCRPGGAHLVDQMNYTCDIDLFREWARVNCWGTFNAPTERKYNTAIIFKRAHGQGRIIIAARGARTRGQHERADDRVIRQDSPSHRAGPRQSSRKSDHDTRVVDS